MQIQIKPRYWILLALLAWGGVILALGMLRLDTYGVNEAAARSLLLGWSVVDKVVSPAVVLGFPDFRALLFFPVSLYWPGSIIAVKVFTMIITFIAGVMFYRWNRQYAHDEAAMIATGLMLIAPLTIQQIDTLGAGPYLLLAFALGHWLDHAYRDTKRQFGGWFFLQMILAMIAVSMHPIGLAYPLALMWEWHANPLDQRQKKQTFIGVLIAVIFVLLLRKGWPTQVWLNNPYTVFTDFIFGFEPEGNFYLAIGAILGALTIIALVVDLRKLFADLTGRMLLFGFVIGLFAADSAWAFLGMSVLLYCGIPRLISVNEALDTTGLVGQRGLVLVISFLLALLFMQSDKGYQSAVARNALLPVDRLLLTLETELEDAPADENILIMSQWPGRTMLAIKRPSLPLPPTYKDSDTLLKNIKGTTHLIFNPFIPDNKPLADQLFAAAGSTKTISLQEGGVILRILDATETADEASSAKDNHPALPSAKPPAEEKKQ